MHIHRSMYKYAPMVTYMHSCDVLKHTHTNTSQILTRTAHEMLITHFAFIIFFFSRNWTGFRPNYVITVGKYCKIDMTIEK